MKISEQISKLVTVWMLWMKNHAISVDETVSYKKRRKAVTECERLIDMEYEIIRNLDKIFDEKLS